MKHLLPSFIHYSVFECDNRTEQVFENWEALLLWIDSPLLLMSFAVTLTPLNRSLSYCFWLAWPVALRLVLACHCKWLTAFSSLFPRHEGRDRSLYLRSTAKWKPPTFSGVDVLNYFSSVQKDEHRKARCVKPAGHKNTVLLPLHDWYVKSHVNKILQNVVSDSFLSSSKCLSL